MYYNSHNWYLNNVTIMWSEMSLSAVVCLYATVVVAAGRTNYVSSVSCLIICTYAAT